MFSNKVKDIYDTLSSIESKKNVDSAYPIHKRLQFENANLKDIYHWIIDQYPIKDKDEILDVGCGVGFGTQLFANSTKASAKGITLSEIEAGIAKDHAAKNGIKNITFSVQSFDEPISEQYNTIVCVESIKHSEKLSFSMDNLLKALKPNGKMLIVEDFYDDNTPNKKEQELVGDWSLAKLYTKKDYTDFLDENGYQYCFTDLTSLMPQRSSFNIKKRYLGSNFLKYMPGYKSFFEIMRGGLVLEMMYKEGQMTYEVLEITKKEAS